MAGGVLIQKCQNMRKAKFVSFYLHPSPSDQSTKTWTPAAMCPDSCRAQWGRPGWGTRPSLDPGSALARVHLEPVTRALTVSSALFLEYYFEFYFEFYFENKARVTKPPLRRAAG